MFDKVCSGSLIDARNECIVITVDKGGSQIHQYYTDERTFESARGVFWYFGLHPMPCTCFLQGESASYFRDILVVCWLSEMVTMSTDVEYAGLKSMMRGTYLIPLES